MRGEVEETIEEEMHCDGESSMAKVQTTLRMQSHTCP